MDDALNAFTIRSHVFDVAERLEQELGEEQNCFIEGCQRDWNQLPAPDVLQIRTRVLNEEWENTFRSWYPAFRPKVGAEVNNAA